VEARGNSSRAQAWLAADEGLKSGLEARLGGLEAWLVRLTSHPPKLDGAHLWSARERDSPPSCLGPVLLLAIGLESDAAPPSSPDSTSNSGRRRLLLLLQRIRLTICSGPHLGRASLGLAAGAARPAHRLTRPSACRPST
jgi:hypothetical protein